jgi:hypothetical protein
MHNWLFVARTTTLVVVAWQVTEKRSKGLLRRRVYLASCFVFSKAHAAYFAQLVFFNSLQGRKVDANNLRG